MNVLIIGGASDIGINIALYFKKLGYNVIVGYHKAYMEVSGIDFVKCDVRLEEEIDYVIKNVISRYGKIDILVNLACISRDNSFLNKTKQEFIDVLEVNLVGTFLCNQIYSRYIDDGLIINMSSTDGVDTYSEYSIDYSASKAGIINMSKSVALSTGNKVLCICPNWIDSDSTRGMNREYLESELERIGQSRLIKIDELIVGFDKIINGDNLTGDVFRIDIRDDKLWIEKIF